MAHRGSLSTRRNLTATLALLLSAASASAEAPQNFVQNGDFASGLQEWSWYATPKAQATSTLDTAEKHSGTQSVRLTSMSENEPHVFGGLYQVAKGLQPNTQYRLTLWAKGTKVSNCWTGGGTGWMQRKNLPSGDFDWQKISMDMKTGANETTLEIRVNVDGLTQALWIDDVELRTAQAAESAGIYAPTIHKALASDMRFYPALPQGSSYRAPVAMFRDPADTRFGADVQIHWSDKSLHLLVKVLDSTPSDVLLHDAMWRGDSIQVAFDMDPLTAKPGGYTPSCVEAAFGLSSSGKVEGHCFYAADVERFDFSAIQSSGKRVDGGYILDLTIPWTNFNLHEPPRVFGLNILVNDSQSNGTRRCTEWTPGIGSSKMPDQYTRVNLVPASKSLASVVLLDQKKYGASDTVMGRYFDLAFQPQPENNLQLDISTAGANAVDALTTKLPAVQTGAIREVKFAVPAKLLAKEGTYTFTATLHHGGSEPVAVQSALREDPGTRVAQQIPALQSRLQQLQARVAANPAVAADSYVKLGTTLADRFIKRIATGGPNGKQDAGWSLLQASEISYVMDQTEQRLERLSKGLTPIHIPQPPMGKVQHRDGLFWIDQTNQPAFLYGYGHFNQVVRDIPNFSTLGASLIQQEVGPTRFNADYTMNQGGQAALDMLAKAAAGNMRVDLLLSPHYFPQWAYDKVPEVKLEANYGFIKYDIDHPYAREVIETYLHKVVPLIKNSPALLSLCLTNEPVYTQSGRTPSSAKAWTEYLQQRYGTIAALNAAYETSYGTIEEVPVPPATRPTEIRASRQYFDWIVFNQEHFAQWHQWLNTIVKSEAPNLPTHTKVMNTIFDTGALHYGTDPELLCNITDIAGNDAYAMIDEGGKYAYGWQIEQIWYDLLHSFRGQTVFNSENHFIRDNTPAQAVPPAFTRATFWQGALHHQGATTLWVWEEQGNHVELDGSIYMRPANIYTTAETFFDLRRHADKVAQLSQQKAKIALLYSVPSLYWSSDYSRLLRRVYAGLQFLGQPVTFMSEKQLAAGTRSPANDEVQVLILPRATHVTPEALKGIEKFVAAGGKVIFIGDECLAYDDHSHAATSSVRPAIQLPVPADEQATSNALRAPLRQYGVAVQDLLTAGTQNPTTGVEYRVLQTRDQGTLISLINFTRGTVKVTLPVNGNAVDLLADGTTINPASVELAPMEPRLIQINAK